MLTTPSAAPPGGDIVVSLRAALDDWFAPGRGPLPPSALLKRLVDRRLDDLPLPGRGATFVRWRALSEVASRELSLAKLYEGHTDALAILREVDATGAAPPPGSTWGVWAAEPPDAKVVFAPRADGRVELRGRKAWCSGADTLSHALLTAWGTDGSGPHLVKVALHQPGVSVRPDGWVAVGMADSMSVDVIFDAALGERVGRTGDYLSRPGFWHGAIGIAACWYGGALALARSLHAVMRRRAAAVDETAVLGRAALGKVDVALQQSAALLHEAARWVDAHPAGDARALAWRVRLGTEGSVGTVIDEVGRLLGATPYCRDPRFARMAADLPVYLRQSHADRDFAALGRRVATATEEPPWAL